MTKTETPKTATAAWGGGPEDSPYSLEPRERSPARRAVSKACKCGHAERWHNKPVSDGGANWGPVGCYFITDPDRPTVCSCSGYRER